MVSKQRYLWTRTGERGNFLMADLTARHGLNRWVGGQFQPYVSVNETINQLDAISGLDIINRDLTAPPGGESDGDTFIVGPAATGAWAGQDGNIAYFLAGAYKFFTPVNGQLAWIEDENLLLVYDGGWTNPEIKPAKLGINATADATNRLSVTTPAVLFNAETDDIQVKLSKAAIADTASFLFQTAFSGRAEIGLVGDDSFKFKVSPDGISFTDALTLDKTTGFAGFNQPLPITTIDARQDGSQLFALESYLTSSTGTAFNFSKARGTIAAPLVVLAGDTVGNWRSKAYDGTVFKNVCQFRMLTQSVSGALISGKIEVRNSDTAGALQTRVIIDENGNFTIGAVIGTTRLDVDGPIKCQSYTVSTVPSASAHGAGAQIYVSNEVGGAVLAFSDATNWLRVTDRAIVA